MPLHRRPAVRPAAVRPSGGGAPGNRERSAASDGRGGPGTRLHAVTGTAEAADMDAQAKKRTLRMLSNGVYVLTSRSENRYGPATVTWVSQASFKPPLIMAAVRRESNVYRCLTESHSAVLHIVGDRQQESARR